MLSMSTIRRQRTFVVHRTRPQTEGMNDLLIGRLSGEAGTVAVPSSFGLRQAQRHMYSP
jgi:hypothetical protein